MFEFIFGAFALLFFLGAIKTHLRHRRMWRRHFQEHHGHRGPHGHRWGGRRRDRGARHEGWRRPGVARAVGEVFKRRLDVDPDQEGIVDHAMVDLHRALEELTTVMKGSRTELAEAFAAPEVDDGAIEAIFTHHDDSLKRARRDVVSALKQVHAVLDPEQRERAVQWLGTGSLGWA